LSYVSDYTFPDLFTSVVGSVCCDRHVIKLPVEHVDISFKLICHGSILLGNIHYDDHCRICHRLGDLLCCETCPAVFHLECVEPPMEDVPEEDWQCGVCKAHKVRCSGIISYFLAFIVRI